MKVGDTLVPYFTLRPEPEIEAWAEAVLLGRMCNRNQLLFLKGVFQLLLLNWNLEANICAVTLR